MYRRHFGNKLNWFNNKTAFFFDGYPSSGNTFLTLLLKKTYDKLEISHHYHSIGAIKIALSKQLTTFIIYRDPTSTILSFYIKEYSYYKRDIDLGKPNKKYFNSLIDSYIGYYDYVLKAKGIHLISFESLISMPESVIISLNKKLPSDYRRDDNDIRQIVSKTKDIEFGAKGILQSSRPNAVKENFKNELKKYLYECEKIEKANELYEKLKRAHNNTDA